MVVFPGIVHNLGGTTLVKYINKNLLEQTLNQTGTQSILAAKDLFKI